MPMNKVVHAAQRAAFSAAIDSAIKAVRGKGPENMAEQAVKLVNLAQPLLAHRYPDADWDKVRAFVSDPGSKWMEYAYKAINEIDPHILKMNTLNLVYEGMFAGYNYVMELRRKYDCNMPWILLFDPTSACNLHCKGCWAAEYGNRLNLSFEDMMAELQEIKEAVTVHQTILVVDAMTGQDAVNVASSFNDKIGIDGVIVTKLDGDTRGGAALSIKAVTGRPILYVGMGEKLSDLEQFYPDRMASRILGMGDVLSLIEKAGAELDEEKAKKMADKMKKAQFDFEDCLDSMEQMRKMGGLSSIMGMMPGMGNMAGKMPDLDSEESEKKMAQMEAMIFSMTPEERRNPDLLNPSRKHRIAKGAGVDIADVNRMVKQFNESRKMMKKLPGLMGGKGGKRGRFRLPF